MPDPSILPGWTLYSWEGGGRVGPKDSVLSIASCEMLGAELDRLRMQRPQYIEVVNPGFGVLILGIAPSIAYVEWREGDNFRDIVRGVVSSPQTVESEVEFEAPGGSLEYEADYLLPYSSAIEIILHCVQHGSFPEWAPQERQRIGSLDVERRV